MKKIGILGHFAFGKETTSGQIIKTKVVGNELVQKFGENEVTRRDTSGGLLFLFIMPWIILRLLIGHRNIIIMPAHHGIRTIAPTLAVLNIFFHRKLHYIVIGSWLPELATRSWAIRHCLSHFHGIYIETTSMQREMQELNVANVSVMPNFKALDIIGEDRLPTNSHPPYRLCTFSRVMRSKGIEDAVNAVNTYNQTAGSTVFTLDIFGQIENGEEKWFSELMQAQQDNIRYKGIIAFDKSTEVLKDYDALVFPTYYDGEGFAGTVIDAMSSGLPIIASDWHENPSIIDDGKTGLLFPTHSVQALVKILDEMAHDRLPIREMRSNCLKEARKYLPENVMKTLYDSLA